MPREKKVPELTPKAIVSKMEIVRGEEYKTVRRRSPSVFFNA
jgi:hypothetical protein